MSFVDAVTSTAIQVAQSRDALDLVVAIFTITTGVVLALAAFMAFVIQRARYFREIQPDLRVVGYKVIPRLAAQDAGPASPVLQIEYEIQNVSSNPAVVESSYLRLDAIETQGMWSKTNVDSEMDLDQRVVLPKDTVTKTVSLSIGLGDETGTSTAATTTVDMTQMRFFLRIAIYYSTQAEFLLRVLNFGSRARNRYVRNAEFSWRVRELTEPGAPQLAAVDLSPIDNERGPIQGR